MKAIETIFDGTKFRSRLEAKWAVTFKQLGVEALYEPEGWEHGGEFYLPDFSIPEWRKYISIKPLADYAQNTKAFEKELEWLREFSCNGMPMWLICGEPSEKYVLIAPMEGTSLVTARIHDCRRCGGYCLVWENGWGDIGDHDCGSEKEPCGTDRIARAMFAANNWKFGKGGIA